MREFAKRPNQQRNTKVRVVDVNSYRYFIVYKPYGMVSQFSPSDDKPVLADLVAVFPKDVYPVGRLDTDSEGLLIITNDKSLTDLLLNPINKHQRTYYVQVEGEVNNEAIAALQKGVEISINGTPMTTAPASVQVLRDEPSIPERNPPIRVRKSIPTTWISLSLTEGKNRQVRRMTAAVGFPTLRLVRTKIEKISLQGMDVGDVVEMHRNDVYRALNIKM